MRPRNDQARDQLRTLLRRRAAVSAPVLADALAVSVPTLHRMLQELGDDLVTAGRARRARHACRRPLRGDGTALPIYEVDADGRADRVSLLDLVQPEGACAPLAETGWPVPEGSRDGWWKGLPYPLYDMRPQGYLGRRFALAEHQALGVPVNLERWNDDDIVWALAQRGADTCGNLILGDRSLERWQAARLAEEEPLAARGLAKAYAALAEQAVGAGVPGASAAGEFPKFTALRELKGSATPHVLVKFSGADRGSATVQRWSDLLVCEHLALRALAQVEGMAAATSRLFEQGGRSFLEVERFDRHGRHGRSRLVSLATLDAAGLGDGSGDWTRQAARFRQAALLPAQDVARIERLWWFGHLIANSDMHAGNLSFRPVGGRLALAPAYDMLPMLYAPLPGGELPRPAFEPPLPLPPQRAPWLVACGAALGFWAAVSADARVSEGFRAIAAANRDRLYTVARHA